jgi:hypothetical protein
METLKKLRQKSEQDRLRLARLGYTICLKPTEPVNNAIENLIGLPGRSTNGTIGNRLHILYTGTPSALSSAAVQL